jgi:hypothetical protein
MANMMITIELPYKLFKVPQDKCPTCQIVHHVKTYHLPLDDQASIVVSTGAHAQLKEFAGLPNFMVEGEVLNPPSARLDMGKDLPQERIVREKPIIRLRNVGVSTNG